MLEWQQWYKGIQNWKDEWHWVKQHGKGRHPTGIILKASLATIVYAIWNEGNARIFQKQCRPFSVLLRQIKLNLCIRVRGNSRLTKCINKYDFGCIEISMSMIAASLVVACFIKFPTEKDGWAYHP